MALPILKETRAAKSLPRRNDGSLDLQPVAIAPGDLVRVKNNDDHHYEFRWNNIAYRVPPGAEGHMPFECAANWFGDPRSGPGVSSVRDPNGVVGFIPDRETEVRRLRNKYGIVGGPEGTLHDSDGNPQHPNVEVYDIDGNRILTVLDDPAGETAHPVVQTQADVNSLQRQIAQMQRQMEAVLAQQNQNEGGRAIPAIDPNRQGEDDDEAVRAQGEPDEADRSDLPPLDES